MLGFFQSSWFAPTPLDAGSPALADAAVRRRRELSQEQALLNGKIRVAGTEISVRGGELRKTWYANRQSYLAPYEKRVLKLELRVIAAELEAAVAAGAPERLLNDLRQTLADRKAAVEDFRPRNFRRESMKELGYEIRGHKSLVGLIPRARQHGLDTAAKELEELDQFWTDEKAEWVHRHRFGSYLKTDPEVAEMAAWDDRVIEIQAELDQLQTRQLIVRCEGGLRRAEDLEPFESEAKADKRAFYPELVPAYFGDARLLRRGDVLEPDRLVPRGFPTFFGGGSPDVTGSGRLELADWLTEPDSIQAALVARAAVNRAWGRLFGEALCRTPKELGRLGAVPEAPEIIDSLAVRFVEDGWSMKSLIRRIALSQAYRRESIPTPSAAAADPDNRWFARQNVRRLEAEPILNTMAYLHSGERHADPHHRDAKLPRAERYYEIFDGPTTIDLIDRRVASISASQALFMMNDPSATREVADRLANRLNAQGATSLNASLDRIYTICLQREPSEDERRFAQTFAAHRPNDQRPSNPESKIREFIHLLLCANEAIYIE
jgi:hypothetical protein